MEELFMRVAIEYLLNTFRYIKDYIFSYNAKTKV